ncbi:MAG: aminoglycoside phosphotransferase family protein [Thermomicrobiales bacterium]
MYALLRRWLPGQDFVVDRAESGWSTPVYRITAGTEVFFLRLGEEAGERRDAEVRVHQLLRAAGVPVPAIVAWEADPPELDRCATLTTSMPGVALIDLPSLPGEQRALAAREAGRDLARIHQVAVRGYGWVDAVDPADGSLIAEHSTRSAWASEYEDAGREILGSHIFSPADCLRLRDALDRWLALPARETREMSVLAHGDFDATHIFVDPETGRYTGIIDFGEIRGSDPLYDLGHAMLQDADPNRLWIFPDLLTGYRDIVPLPDDAGSAIRDQAIAIGTRQLAIFLRRSSPYAPMLASQLTTLLAASSETRNGGKDP